MLALFIFAGSSTIDLATDFARCMTIGGIEQMICTTLKEHRLIAVGRIEIGITDRMFIFMDKMTFS